MRWTIVAERSTKMTDSLRDGDNLAQSGRRTKVRYWGV